MIVLDTSALMAIALREPEAKACIGAVESEDDIRISAVTLAEALIVAERRGVADEVHAILETLGVEIVDVTGMAARRVSEAYRKWGKGFHAASLNFGDCFAYDLARQSNCALLYIGNDFSRTDIKGAL